MEKKFATQNDNGTEASCIKSCPMCGGRAKVSWVKRGFSAVIKCEKCGLHTDELVITDSLVTGIPDFSTLLAKWNERV